MSEKRFTIEKIFKEYPKLRDNETECFYHLVDNERNAEIFCERLNNLVEENEKLRFLIDINSVSERKKLERQVDEQQAIIQSLKEENEKLKHYKLYEDNKRLQTIIADLKDDKNQLHKVISKLRQEVAELKTRNSVLSSKLNQIPKSIKEVWLE